MRLYNSNFAPNPRRVRVFLSEKGLSIPRVDVDLANLEHKTPDYSVVNPFQLIPALELDDGTVIGESIAICRYIEELHPEPNLFGADPLERAMVEMWQRRVEWQLLLPIAQVFRHTHPHMAKLEDPQIADWASANRPRVLRSMTIFNDVLRDRSFVAGDRFTVADITGLVALDFTRSARIAIPPELADLTRWHEALRSRASASA